MGGLTEECAHAAPAARLCRHAARLLEPRARFRFRMLEPRHVKDRHPLRALPDRLPAHRRRAHGPVQLALRPALRRHVPPAHRGHRPRALDAGRGRRHPRRPQLARPPLGRRGDEPVRPRLASSRGGRPDAGQRRRLPLLRERRRSSRRCARRRGARAGRCATTAAGATAIRPKRPPASPRSSGCAPGRRARRSSTTRCRARSSSPTRTSTISCCCAPTATRPTCSRSWSTITTWASPTSSAATTI